MGKPLAHMGRLFCQPLCLDFVHFLLRSSNALVSRIYVTACSLAASPPTQIGVGTVSVFRRSQPRHTPPGDSACCCPAISPYALRGFLRTSGDSCDHAKNPMGHSSAKYTVSSMCAHGQSPVCKAVAGYRNSGLKPLFLPSGDTSTVSQPGGFCR